MEMQPKSFNKNVSRLLDALIAMLAVGTFLWLVSYGVLLWEDPARLVLVFLPMCIIIWALQGIKNRSIISALGNKWNIVVGTAIIAVSALIAAYFFLEYQSLAYERAGNNTAVDFILGGTAVFLVIFAAWKTTGSAIPIVVLFFLFYAFFGNVFPGVMGHPGLSWRRVLMLSAVEIDGIFGEMPAVGFTTVIIFLYFAGFAESFGAMEYITKFAMRLLRKFKWGLAQISVVTSMIFGMFSGSAAANVAADGVFNIPLMKGFGIKPATAGAIEAVASAGGQIMPPVMGVAAFLMADFLGIRYIEVVIMGFPPAILFYLFVAFSIFLRTRRLLAGLTWADSTGAKEDTGFRWSAGLPLLISLVVLMFLLEYFGVTVLLAGLLMIVTFVGSSLIYNLVYSSGSDTNIKQFPSMLLKGVLLGTSSLLSIMFLLSAMGIVARVLVTTGLGQKLSFFMVDMSGGHLWILLLLILIVSVLFGMAVSTVVTYLMVILLAAPALLQLGVPLPVAHFVIFYLSLLSAITPPVAIAVAVASSIAKASFMRTGLEAVKLGFPLFVLPFVFVWKPEIIAANWSTPFACLEVAAGFMPICYGMQGEFRGILGNILRLPFFALGFLGIFHSLEVIGWVCLVAGVLLTLFAMIKGRPSFSKISGKLGVSRNE
jgi:TRAP transporter 4TM/12TM fusion protein